MGFLVMREKELCHEGKRKGRKNFMDFLALFIIGFLFCRDGWASCMSGQIRDRNNSK